MKKRLSAEGRKIPRGGFKGILITLTLFRIARMFITQFVYTIHLYAYVYKYIVISVQFFLFVFVNSILQCTFFFIGNKSIAGQRLSGNYKSIFYHNQINWQR